MTAPRRSAAQRSRAAMPDPFELPATQGELTTLNEAHKTQVAKVYGPIERGLALMKEKHGHVLATKLVVTADNLEATKASHKEMVTFRTTLEATRKAEKEESLRYGQLVDAEAKRILAQASPIEEAYKQALDDWAQAEQRRRDGLLQQIAELRSTGQKAIGRDIPTLELMLESITTFPVDQMQEFREQAAAAQEQARQQVAQLLQDARDRAEQERVQGIRARIASMRTAAAQARLATKAATLERMVTHFGRLNPEDTAASWAEFLAEAKAVFDEELASLRQQLADKQRAEAQETENRHLREKLAEMEREKEEQRHREEQRQRDAAAEARRAEQAVAPAAAAPPPASAPAPVVIGGDDKTSAGSESADEPVAHDRLQDGGYFKAVNMGVDGAGDMVGELVPAQRDEPGAMLVEPGNGAEVRVTGMAMPSELGVMPAPPTGGEIVQVLADHFDDHPLNVIGYLEALDFQALRSEFGQPSLFDTTGTPA